MFDIWKRGVHPFDHLREVTSLLPDTPTSMLVRGNSLCSMQSQPSDVVDAFIRCSVAAGIDVMTCFDAHNDQRNHVAVAEATHKYGAHYQAALAFPVYHRDPTIYNAMWAVKWFRTIVRDLSPHSLYIKDPSGVLTPEMAGILAAELKSAFPHLPLIFHTHYQTGYAYASYLEALRNGANAVECSLGFSDGAGQPYSLTMLRMAEDYGLDAGLPNKSAMQRIKDICHEQLRPLYQQANVVRLPDIRVEQTGIAGGQRSILDKELSDAGQSHLIPAVDGMVQQVRREGGLVCQVTPAADSYAREAMRRIRGGSLDKGFVSGYAAILCGECGTTKEPVDAAQRKVALDERLAKQVQNMVNDGRLDSSVAVQLQRPMDDGDGKVKGSSSTIKRTPLSLWRARMDELSAPVIRAHRRQEVESRLNELEAIKQKPTLFASLERKIAMAARDAEQGEKEREIKSLDDRIKLLQQELDQLRNAAKKDGMTEESEKAAEKRYEGLLLGRASTAEYESFVNLSHVTKDMYASDRLKLEQVRELVSACGAITCSPSLLLRPGLPAASSAIREFDDEHLLGLLDSPRKVDENTLLWACYSRAPVPAMLTNFFKHYYTGQMDAFPTLYKGHRGKDTAATTHDAQAMKVTTDPVDRPALPSPISFLYRQIHKDIESALKKDSTCASILRDVRSSLAAADELRQRLHHWSTDPSVSARVAAETKRNVEQRIAQLLQQAKQGEESLIERLGYAILQQPVLVVTNGTNGHRKHALVNGSSTNGSSMNGHSATNGSSTVVAVPLSSSSSGSTPHFDVGLMALKTQASLDVQAHAAAAGSNSIHPHPPVEEVAMQMAREALRQIVHGKRVSAH